MKGIRFYKDLNGCDLEGSTKFLLVSSNCNGLAVMEAHEHEVLGKACIACPEPSMSGDGPYEFVWADDEYIRANCVRVDEQYAKDNFPELITAIGEYNER